MVVLRLKVSGSIGMTTMLVRLSSVLILVGWTLVGALTTRCRALGGRLWL